MLIKVVVREVPFQVIIELLVKLFPFTVNVNVAEPATIVEGLSVLAEGTGLDVVEAIVNTDPLLKPPPGDGLLTVIVAEPGLTIIPEVTLAFS